MIVYQVSHHNGAISFHATLKDAKAVAKYDELAIIERCAILPQLKGRALAVALLTGCGWCGDTEDIPR